ncbi:MAG: sigma-70 family RNA polymerase sigma factor [Anaerolineae bacterium]
MGTAGKESVALSDDEVRLMERVRAHDPSALGEIYDRYARKIYTYLYHRLGDRHLAEELTGDVFVRMVEAARAGSFARTSLSGWLYRIAHNLVADHFRYQKEEAVPLHEGLVAPYGEPGVVTEGKLAQEELRAALRNLTGEQQQVIVLRFGEGLTASRVGEVLGKSEGAVWALQHRALAALRRALEGGAA